ncbi:MAG: hypothetical protein FJ297_13975 [Planctomycetes bacterium]|nr:hypothetical protein [Planctomycetota bacterium]
MRIRFRTLHGTDTTRRAGATSVNDIRSTARPACRSAWLLALALACAPIASAQTPRLTGDQIVPDSAKAFVSVPQPSVFREAWKQTEMGRLFHDPVMDAFTKDLRRQIEERVAQTSARLGLKLNDLEGVASGEMAFALLQPEPRSRFAIAVLADVAGRDRQVTELQAKVREQMAGRGGKSKNESVEGYAFTVWTFPPTEENPSATTAYFCRHADWYVAGDHLPTLTGMLNRIDGRGNDVLAKSAAYRAVMAQSHSTVKGPLHARWFIEPFGFAESIREANLERERGRDKIKIVKEQGFGAIEGLGGVLSFGGDPFEATYHVHVYAPTDARVLAARMLDFPSEPKLAMPDWAPAGSAALLMANWNMRGAFEASKTLVDALSGSEVFEDALTDIHKDPNGLRVNLRDEIIAHLGTRVYVMTQHGKPITTQSEQRLIAFELTDAAKVEATMARALPRDPNVKQRKFGPFVVWEVLRKENVRQGATPGGFQGFRHNKGEPAAADPKNRPLFKNGAMAVAFGYAFQATDVEFLGKFLVGAANQAKLANDPDYQLVDAAILKLVPAQGEVMRHFVRTDMAIETDYELFRQGKMVDNESLLGQLLNHFLAPDEEGLKRKALIDGSKLPPFAQVRQYFQPGGARVIGTSDGWRIVGGLLARDQRRAARN